MLLLLHALVLTRHNRYVSLFVLILFAARLFCKHKRCQLGGVVGGAPDDLPSAGTLTPVQARIELMLDLLAGG